MHHRKLGILRYGFVAAALAVMPLTGCSTSNFLGSSTFGGAPAQIAELPSGANYSAASALSQARAHFSNNDFGYSAALYKKSVELSPQDPQGYIGLGASYDRLGRFDLADRVYAAWYKISGGTAQYYNNVGYSYMLRGNLKAALMSFRKAGKLAPDNLVIANNLQMLADAARVRV